MAKIQMPALLGGKGGKAAKAKAGAKMEAKAEGKAKGASASAQAGTPPSGGSAGQLAAPQLKGPVTFSAKIYCDVVEIHPRTRPAPPLHPAAALAVSGFALGLGLALLPARLGLAALAACAEG